MTPDLHRLIAAISPETYCAPAGRHEVRRLLDEGLKQGDPLAIRRAAEAAEVLPVNDVALGELEPRSAFDCLGLKHPLERHSFSYDCMDDSLEALYFTLLNHLESHGWQVTKLVDHFSSAAGSGFAGDISRRAMKSQEEAAKLLESAQELVGKMLRRVERIKEMERQLGVLSETGNHPVPNLKAPAHKTGAAFVEDDPDEDSPVRLPSSAGELRTRLELERKQLRSQMDLLRLYARWAQPWLRAGEELREHASHRADLVTAFNTALLDVVLLARRELPLAEMIHDGELPSLFAKTPHRNYTPAVLIELRFRTAPRRVTTGTHVHRGRVEVSLTSYALHDAEVCLLQRELDRDDVGHLLGAVGSGSVVATEAMLADIEKLLDAGKETTKEPDQSDPNPFLALWSLLCDLWRWLFAEHPEEWTLDDLTADRDTERILRSQAILLARKECLDRFDTIKHLPQGRQPRV
jgi:hypothetical protein